MSTPIASICIATYNHAKYLEDTLEGILNQRCFFGYEILIHDDASTDGTVDIIKEYAEDYPDIIKPIYETENQYSKGISIDLTYNIPRAQGRYIALCEGDDYWCDPTKLQRQVAYMEKNPNCTLIFTNAYIHDESGQQEDRPFLPRHEEDRPWYQEESRDYLLDEIARLSFIPTASMMFRTETLQYLPNTFFKPCPHSDLRFKLYLTAAGYAHYEHMFSCVYRENVQGSAMQLWEQEDRRQVFERCRKTVEMFSDVICYAPYRCKEGVSAARERFLRVMAHNAPDHEELGNGYVGMVWREMPWKEKAYCYLRPMVPDKLVKWIKKLI